MLLTEAYLAALQRGDIREDSEQRRLLVPLQKLIDALQARESWYRLFLPKSYIRGLYITGPVGAGKTYMMDLFYQSLPGKYKLRAHFLQFMQKIDQKLRFLQGQRDPILLIAKDLAKQYHVICIDELIVDDMAYAMILGELFQALFSLRLILVTTSNTPIVDLYRNGMNRERFLPAIGLLQQHCQEIHLQSATDYRLGKSIEWHAYVYPLNTKNNQILTEQFQVLAMTTRTDKTISVQSRSFAVVQLSTTAIWFEFSVICAMPRCQLDYIELADRFHTIFISNLPKLSALTTHTPVVLFIQLVDVLYDRGIRLILSAEVPIQELYSSGPFLTAFARTLSRLEEMQSEYYLGKCGAIHE